MILSFMQLFSHFSQDLSLFFLISGLQSNCFYPYLWKFIVAVQTVISQFQKYSDPCLADLLDTPTSSCACSSWDSLLQLNNIYHWERPDRHVALATGICRLIRRATGFWHSLHVNKPSKRYLQYDNWPSEEKTR